jgi:hypothetical protein
VQEPPGDRPDLVEEPQGDLGVPTVNRAGLSQQTQMAVHLFARGLWPRRRTAIGERM